MLELQVKMININPAQHHELLDRCQIIKEYGQFVDTVRKFQKAGNAAPIREAIAECVGKRILEAYLRKKGSEVENMLIAEYDYDLDIEVQREEAEEEGRKKGKAEGKAEDILAILTELGTVPAEIRRAVSGERDETRLRLWLLMAARCRSVEEFTEKLKQH